MDNHLPAKFDLSASPASVNGYPVEIDEGEFTGPAGGRIPIPTGHLLYSSWGLSSIVWAVGDPMQPAPDSLHLRWFAYPEDQFYEGHFALPRARIETLLADGYWDKFNKEHGTYGELTVCLLPQGGVAVWLVGGNQVLLGRYQGQPVAYDWNKYSRQPESRAETVRKTLDHMKEIEPNVRALLSAGPPSPAKWDAYLTTYPWKVEVTERTGPRTVPVRLYDYDISYLSAENMRFPKSPDAWVPFLKLVQEPSPKPVPKEFSLLVENEHQEKYELRIDSLDEQETMAAYQEVARRSNRPMTLHVEVDGVYKKATLTLKNDYHEVPLRKAVVEIYRED